MKQEQAERLLSRVDQSKAFFTNSGKHLFDLTDLHSTLVDQGEAFFNHHVTEERHDFADWIEHCIKDTHLSEKLRKNKNYNDSVDAIRKRIAKLNWHKDNLDNISETAIKGPISADHYFSLLGTKDIFSNFLDVSMQGFEESIDLDSLNDYFYGGSHSSEIELPEMFLEKSFPLSNHAVANSMSTEEMILDAHSRIASSLSSIDANEDNENIISKLLELKKKLFSR